MKLSLLSRSLCLTLKEYHQILEKLQGIMGCGLPSHATHISGAKLT